MLSSHVGVDPPSVVMTGVYLQPPMAVPLRPKPPVHPPVLTSVVFGFTRPSPSPSQFLWEEIRAFLSCRLLLSPDTIFELRFVLFSEQCSCFRIGMLDGKETGVLSRPLLGWNPDLMMVSS